MESTMFNYIGIHTARYNNILRLDDQHMLIPLNSTLQVMTFKQNEEGKMEAVVVNH